MNFEDFLWACVIAVLLFFSTGCATAPNGYGQLVHIIGGQYKGQRGRLIGDCSGFENYMVLTFNNKKICARVWHLERF